MESSMFQGVYPQIRPQTLGGLASGLEGLVRRGTVGPQCPLALVPLGYRVTTNPPTPSLLVV